MSSMTHGTPLRWGKVRIYDLAKELKLDTRRLIEEVRREGVDVSVPSNTITTELADKIRNKYFPKKEQSAPRVVRLVSRAVRPTEAPPQQMAPPSPARQVRALRPTQEALNASIRRGERAPVSHAEQPLAPRIEKTEMDPWKSLRTRYHIGDRIRGRVRNLTHFGAFVEIEDGVVGLVHISDFSWSKHINHPSDVLKKGQEIEVVITSIDVEDRRISLSIKELEPSPWEKFVAMHRPGDIVRGRVARFASFGAFVELGDYLEGLCHISELSEERVERAEQAVSIGQELNFKILRIDPENKKIDLSARASVLNEPIIDIKSYATEACGGMASLGELADAYNGYSGKPNSSKPEGGMASLADLADFWEQDPWARFVSEHKSGAVVRGVITRFANFGAFVDLGNNLHGLCHISELSNERFDKPEDVAHLGQLMMFRILRIDPESKKISLSARAVEPQW